jgi:hypothetical protein
MVPLHNQDELINDICLRLSTNTIILKSNEHKSYAWVFSVICTFQSSQFFERLSMHFGVVDHIRASALTGICEERKPFLLKKTDPTFYTPFLFIKYSKTTH